MYSQPFEHFADFLNLISLGFLAWVGSMSTPLLASKLNFDPRAFAFENLCIQRIEQCLDVSEDNRCRGR